MDISKKTYIYLDQAALCDAHCEDFMEEMVEGAHRQMILFVDSVWEEEALKTLSAYEYICRVVYETDVSAMLEKDSSNRKDDRLSRVLVIAETKQQVDDVCVLSLKDGYTLMDVLRAKRVWERKARCCLAIIMVACVAYLGWYFVHLEQLPMWMQEGWAAFLLCLLPIEILLMSIGYGIGKRLISIELLSQLLDF